MKKKLIDYIIDNVGFDEFEFTYGRMCMERCSLRSVNSVLYDRLEGLVKDFVEDNELSEGWFDENFIDIDDLFEEVLV